MEITRSEWDYILILLSDDAIRNFDNEDGDLSLSIMEKIEGNL